MAAQEAKAAGEEGRPKTSGCRSSSLFFFFRGFFVFFFGGKGCARELFSSFFLPDALSLARAREEEEGAKTEKNSSHVKTETTLAWQLKPKTGKKMCFLSFEVFFFLKFFLARKKKRTEKKKLRKKTKKILSFLTDDRDREERPVVSPDPFRHPVPFVVPPSRSDGLCPSRDDGGGGEREPGDGGGRDFRQGP